MYACMCGLVHHYALYVSAAYLYCRMKVDVGTVNATCALIFRHPLQGNEMLVKFADAYYVLRGASTVM